MELRRWLEQYFVSVTCSTLRDATQLVLAETVRRFDDPDVHQVVLVDAEHARDAVERLERCDAVCRPELVLVGVAALQALRIRGRGLPLSIEVREQRCVEAVGAAVQRILHVQLPLRRIAARLTGVVDLPDALAILRYQMFVQAMARSGSKRAAAKLLGITRPAVQHMARSARPTPQTDDAE